MRKVELNMKQQERYEIIKAVSEGHMSKVAAGVRLSVTRRHINRLLNKYHTEGKSAFVHGNTGTKPKHAFTNEQKATIVNLYNTKYYDANFHHASELMLKNDNVSVSPSTLRKLMLEGDVISPKAWRSTKKALKKRLKERQNSLSPKEQTEVTSRIIAVENAHSRRPRAAYFGENIQIDASPHNWFGDCNTHLHAAIDDSSGKIVGAYFDTQETLNGYFHLLHQILTTEGIPNKFTADRRTVFEYKRKASPSPQDDTTTQFGYACKTLGIAIETTSVAQAKGRIERLFETLQSRLPIEFRLAGITDIKKANEILPKLIQDFNDQFSLEIDYNTSVFIEQPSPEKIDQILSVLSERVVDKGQSIRYNNKFYKIIDGNGKQINFRPGTKGLVANTFSGKLYFTVDDRSYVLEEIPVRAISSKEFDLPPKATKSPQYHHIPAEDHPWRMSNFLAYRNKVATKFFLEV